MGGVAALPDGSRYNVAIQSPSVAFKDPRLKTARVAVDRHGLPVVSAGGFAVAYRLDSGSSAWAVRCFTRLTEGLEQRYVKVAAYLSANPSSHWLPVDYLSDGLLVDRRWWPVTVMPWVEAVPLNDWVAGKLGDRGALEAAADQFASIAGQLERASVAHGDLQHGNVLSTADGTLVLVDYDGMFVPGLEGQAMPEVGHPNYQHPGRGTATFGPRLDRFSAAVIWSALRVTAGNPALWPLHDTGENLLFTRGDFANPGQSTLLASLRTDPRWAPLAEGIERLLRVSVDRLPSLGDFIAGKLPNPDPTMISYGAVAPFPVLDLRRSGILAGRQGQRVTAVGQILGLYRGKTLRGDPYLFLTIAGPDGETLKVVLWSEVLGRLTPAQGGSLRAGAIVGATGMLSTFSGQPQIVPERPALLEFLNAGRILDLLGSAWTDKPPEATTRNDLAIGDVVEHDKFGQGVVVAVTADVADVRFSAELKKIAFTQYPLRVVRRPPPVAARPQPGGATSVRSGPPRTNPASPPSGAGHTGFGRQQDEWASLIASSAGSLPRQNPKPVPPAPDASMRAAPSAWMPPASNAGSSMGPNAKLAPDSAASTPPAASGWVLPSANPTSRRAGAPTGSRGRVARPLWLASAALAGAVLVAPSYDGLALALGVAAGVGGLVALGRVSKG